MSHILTYDSAVILPFSSVNISAQIGDMIYYISGNNENDVRFLGEITNIDTVGGTTNIMVIYNSAEVSLPPSGAFIFFAKNKQVNTSSLLGYYASVNFVNNSTKKAELFAIGSEISESSK
jgi:hypothetical protein